MSFEPLPYVLPIAYGLLLAALLLGSWRVVRGPHLADRLVAMDLLAGVFLSLLILLAIDSGLSVYLNVALTIAVMGFLGTAALAIYLERSSRP